MANRLNRILNSQDLILKTGIETRGYRSGKSFGEIDDIYKASNGLCEICGASRGKRNHALDHDHATGKLRGVLCAACNQGLGHFKDSEALLLKAIAYLVKHKSE